MLTEDPVETTKQGRDDLVFENAELNRIVSRLKEQIRGLQRAKEEALSKLEATTAAWKSALLTRDALAELTQLSPADAGVIASHIARAEKAEAELKVAERWRDALVDIARTLGKLGQPLIDVHQFVKQLLGEKQKLDRDFASLEERERVEALLNVDLRCAQDTVIERCAQAVQEQWPEAAVTLRAHVDGVSGEDWGELNREVEALRKEVTQLRVTELKAELEAAKRECRVLRVDYDTAFQEGLETADEVAVQAATKTLKQHLGNLVARLDRDGGHRQALDETLEATAARADVEVVRLQMAAENLEKLKAGLKTEEGVLKAVREYLLLLTDEGREAFFYEMERGYCGSCGRILPEGGFCTCTDDE